MPTANRSERRLPLIPPASASRYQRLYGPPLLTNRVSMTLPLPEIKS